MAQDHSAKNSLSPPHTKVAAWSGPGPTGTEAPDRNATPILTVALLGLNAWGVIGGWSFVSGAGPSWASQAAGLLAGMCLAVGLWQLGTRREPWHVRLWLLCLYPSGLGAMLALATDATADPGQAPLAALLATLSLLAYLGGTARTLWSTRPVRPLVVRPLAPNPAARTLSRSEALRRAVTWLMVTGAGLVCMAAVGWDGQAPLKEAWGASWREGGVLTAVVGAALATAVVTVFLGSAQRAAKPDHRTRSQRRFAVASLMFLSLLGAATFLVTR